MSTRTKLPIKSREQKMIGISVEYDVIQAAHVQSALSPEFRDFIAHAGSVKEQEKLNIDELKSEWSDDSEPLASILKVKGRKTKFENIGSLSPPIVSLLSEANTSSDAKRFADKATELRKELRKQYINSINNKKHDGTDFAWRERCRAILIMTKSDFVQKGEEEKKILEHYFGIHDVEYLYTHMCSIFKVETPEIGLQVHQFKSEKFVDLPSIGGLYTPDEIIKYVFLPDVLTRYLEDTLNIAQNQAISRFYGDNPCTVFHTYVIRALSNQPDKVTVISDFNVACSIRILHGNITEQPHHAIINAANGNLQPGGGVAFVISKAAGKAFDRECKNFLSRQGPLKCEMSFLSSVGDRGTKLQCLYAIHTVGGCWSVDENVPEILVHCVESVIKETNAKRLKSIVLPMISTLEFGGGPHSNKLSGQTLCNAAINSLNKNKTLQWIDFILYGHSKLQHLFEGMETEWSKKSPIYQNGFDGKEEIK